ncbi:MAG: IS200/IS605 family transposase [Desulfamplus sp.]|nr:IS200/IS605 family transposase [Desulfamplus sp.]
MAFWRLFYHIVWGTKDRQQIITEDIEEPLYQYVVGKSDSLKSIVHAVGGMADHIHLVASIPPKLSISDYVGKIKGGSSHFVNHNLGIKRQPFAWQGDYGVFSLGSKQLEIAVNYVIHQKEHHYSGTIISSLENIDIEQP